MKRMKIYAALISASVLLASVGGHSSGKVIMDLPKVTSIDLANGIKGFYVQDEIPQTTIVVSIPFGRMSEDRSASGLSDLLVKALTMSGSKKYPGTAAYEKIESLGGRLYIGSSWESTTLSVQILSRFSEDAFAVISDIISAPDFNAKNFESARALAAEEVRRRYDDPFNLAFDRIRTLIFDGSGYGSVPTVEVMNRFTLADVEAAHKKYFCAPNILFGVSSSIESGAVMKSAEKYFSGIRRGEKVKSSIDYSSAAARVRDADKKVYLYVSDIPQATVIVGTKAPGILSEDIYSLSVMDYVLGGGSFNSRLTTEIRVKRGLAYVAQSVYRPRGDAGIFMALAQTKNESAAEVMSIMLTEIKSMAAEGPTADELTWAKESISNSYVFKFDSRMNLLSNYLTLEMYRLPSDYYEQYPSKIASLSGAHVADASNRLFAGGLVRVVVGRRSVAESLKPFGEVVIVDGPVKK